MATLMLYGFVKAPTFTENFLRISAQWNKIEQFFLDKQLTIARRARHAHIYATETVCT